MKKHIVRKKKRSAVRVPSLKNDVGLLLCGSDGDGGHRGLTDGDYLLVLCGNSKGMRKLGRYFLALAISILRTIPASIVTFSTFAA